MIVPILAMDSEEKWLPVPVETIITVGAKIDDELITDLEQLKGSDKKIDFPSGMTQPTVEPVAYYRIVEGGGLHWHQFWLFYLYNPKKYAGFGEHEGDWEMVQIASVYFTGDIPVLMTCSQHSEGEKREYWRTELKDDRPVVYVARDSHANYFTTHKDVTDTADGKGTQLTELQIRDFGAWCEWPGKWGNSENSPGPLSTRRAWIAPHAYHSQSRG